MTSKDNNADNTELSLFCIHNVFIVFWLNCIKRIMKHIREIVYEERAKRGVYVFILLYGEDGDERMSSMR